MVGVRVSKALSASAVVIGALLASEGASLSADLPTHKEPISPLTPTPAYNWGGFYVGVNGGGAWGQQDPLGAITNRFDNASFAMSGGVFGGTLGAQLQQGHVVLGVEGDLDWANITGSKTYSPTIAGVAQPFTLTTQSNIDWTTTGRLRLGYAQDNMLFYGTVGLAMLGSRPHMTVLNGLSCASPGVNIPNCSSNPIKGGLAAGLGFEYGFAQNWSAKLEWLYVGQLQGVNTQNADFVRVGLNYHFGG